MKIQVLKNEDGYEALYINDLYIEEGNPLNEGSERVLYFLNICKQYGVSIEDIEFYYLICGTYEFKNRMSEYNIRDLTRDY